MFKRGFLIMSVIFRHQEERSQVFEHEEVLFSWPHWHFHLDPLRV